MTNHPNRSKRGRPRDPNARQNITRRFAPDVIELIRASTTEQIEVALREGLTLPAEG